MTRYKHTFTMHDRPWVWVSDEPHSYGLIRTSTPSNPEVGGDGMLKAFRKEDREAAIAYAKGQRDLPIHRGYKLRLVKLDPVEFTPTAVTGARGSGSHANCDHPPTPAARRECRAKRKAGVY